MKITVVFWGILYGFGLGFAAAQSPESARWGAWIGWETQMLAIEPLQTPDPNTPTFPSGAIGIGPSVGFCMRWPLWRDLAVQSELAVSTLGNRIYFDAVQPVFYRFTDVELPLHLVWTKPATNAAVRGSFLLGGRLGWNVAHQPRDRLALLRERAALDVGLGLEIPLKRGFLRPEVLYAYGLNNLHEYTNTLYDPLVGRMQRDKLIIRILFLWGKPQS